MDFIELHNLSCEYNGGQFCLSWEIPPKAKVNCIIIAEVEIRGGEIIININSIRVVSGDMRKASVSPSANIKENIRHFIILGSRLSSESITPREIKNFCNGIIDQKAICCSGLLTNGGKISWKISRINQIVTLHIESTIEIPEGFLEYAYKYCDVDFHFLIYGTIPKYNKNDSNSYRNICFEVPAGVSDDNICLCSPGTAITIVKVKGKNSIVEAMKTFFSKKEDT